MKKIFVYVVGTLILSPIVIMVASGNLWFVFSAILYGIILFVLSTIIDKVRDFWKQYVKTILSASNFC